MITVKVYRQGAEVLVAACDSDILGKTFRSQGLKLHLSEGFYQGETADEDKLVNRLEMATVANLAGRRTLEIAIRRGFVDAACVIEIGGVPHAQMARMI